MDDGLRGRGLEGRSRGMAEARELVLKGRRRSCPFGHCSTPGRLPRACRPIYARNGVATRITQAGWIYKILQRPHAHCPKSTSLAG